MNGFLRHFATRLIFIKKSTIFANSTLMILIPSVRFIPSMVAPQQSHSPFFLTRKDSENFNDTVCFALPNNTKSQIAYHLHHECFRIDHESVHCYHQRFRDTIERLHRASV